MARLGDCGVSRLDRIRAAQKASKEKSFSPLDLNEGNVQAIFNRCLATKDTPEGNISKSILFSRTLGYKPSVEVLLSFDKQKLLANKKNILYLFGQLGSVHQRKKEMSLRDARYNYVGKSWTESGACSLNLLYLVCTDEIFLISPFQNEVFLKFGEDNDYDTYLKNLTTPSDKDTAGVLLDKLRPTLSPKDPSFPAWWEAHKGEWED